MRIIVCVKEVTECLLEQSSISQRIPAGILARLSVQDRIAMEEALLLKEKYEGDIIALCLGAEDRALRRALTSGADRAILVEDAMQNQGDWYTTSFILAQAASRIGFDVIICGTWSPDEMDRAIGPGIAEHLGIPVIMDVVKIDVLSGNVRALQVCKKLPKGLRETYMISLPCVVAVEEGLNQPRYVPIYGEHYRQGWTKSVERMTTAELGLDSKAMSTKTTVLDICEMKPRTCFGVKVTGLSATEKLKMLVGGSSKASGNKKELIVHDPSKAARILKEKLSEWLNGKISEKSG